jgi:hypothetical protein
MPKASSSMSDFVYDPCGNRYNEPTEAVIEQLRDDVHLETVNAEVRDPRSGRAQEATIAFTLSYENQSPKLARNVANELVSLYLNENLKNRTEAAVETSQFLAEEAQKLAAKVSELEKRRSQLSKWRRNLCIRWKQNIRVRDLP